MEVGKVMLEKIKRYFSRELRSLEDKLYKKEQTLEKWKEFLQHKKSYVLKLKIISTKKRIELLSKAIKKYKEAINALENKEFGPAILLIDERLSELDELKNPQEARLKYNLNMALREFKEKQKKPQVQQNMC